ncbi:MAG: LTA synthase family protein [Chitinophagaceae bacterium]|jgi:hypothetical protein|nr:LTA synthase family protein [Chitinophagaceae bacterium]
MRILYQQITQFFKTRPLFLLLLPLFFIYSGYNELFGFLSFPFVVRNFAVCVVCMLVLFLVSFFFLKTKTKASVFTFFCALFFLVFGYLHDSLKQLSATAFFTKFTVLLPLCTLLLFILFLYLKKRKKDFTELYLFLNALFCILLFSEIPNSIKRYRLDQSVHNLIDFRLNAFNSYKPSAPVADSLKPDIYFLVFDAMTSSKGLMQVIGKNHTELDSFLRQHEFYIAENASANYNSTVHSLSTTFNMDYLPTWIVPVANDPKALFWGSASILNNSLFSILQKEGYETKSYQPISFDNKDWNDETFFSNLKKNHFYFKTLPGRLSRDLFWNYSKIDLPFIHQKQIQFIEDRNQQKQQSFNRTAELLKNSCSTTGKPKFVYSHFMIPHEQYIFDSTGKLKLPLQTIIHRKEEDAPAYYQQVIYAGKVIKDLVQHIRENNKKNTVIIVAGDHGYRTEQGNKTGYTFSNLQAIYFPDRQYQQLYDSISPVNTFRVVLNKYFNAGFTLHADSSILVSSKKETIRKSEKIQPARTP